MQRFPASEENLSALYSPSKKPIGTVIPGERFQVETLDCYGGRYQEASGFTHENREWVEDNENILTGPVHVQGANPGDVVAVTIHDIEITTPGSYALYRLQAYSPQDWWHEAYSCMSLPITGGQVVVSDTIKVPVRPLVGCLGTVPRQETVRSIREGDYGGNMDCGDVTTGATLVLRSEVPGALLYFGDCKARVASGELVQPPEIGTRLTLSVEVRPRPRAMTWPRLEYPDRILTIASERDLTTATRTAFKELMLWLEEDTGASRQDIAIVMGMVADSVPCQASNTLHTAHCEISRSWVDALRAHASARA
jgi:acetamidase/formamidase